jgi:uncharacterized protein (TIGR02996 family)
MTEVEALRAVLDQPDDDAPRLAYAALMDQRGDVRGEFIRLQLREARATADMEKSLLSSRTDRLLMDHRSRWSLPVKGITESYAFHRGFIAYFALPARVFLDNADRILGSAPIQHVSFSDPKPWLGDLLDSRYLRQMRSLSFDQAGLDNEDLKRLAASPNLGELRWLSLGGNSITLPGIVELAKSTALPRLRYANFGGNPVDPGEQHVDDQGIIVESWMPSSGEWLEEEYGPLPWLHVPAATTDDLPPDRFTIN